MLKAKWLLHIINGLCREVALLLPTSTSSVIIDFAGGEVVEFWLEVEFEYMEKVLLLPGTWVEILESTLVPFIENHAAGSGGLGSSSLLFFSTAFLNTIYYHKVKFNTIKLIHLKYKFSGFYYIHS